MAREASARTRADELTVDELARAVDLPVRTIREYQTLRLLPPPRRRGRIGLYGDEHRQRLELIARLQQRGYSLAGIKDLLAAWDAGAGLPALLGLPVGSAALDETPMRLTRRELDARLPGLTTTLLRRACTAGLVQSDGDRYIARSPALLALVADGTNAGVPVRDMIKLAAILREHLHATADALADQLVTMLPISGSDDASTLEPLLRRGRLLLLQGASSLLADRLGDALLHRAGQTSARKALRDATERIRVGVVVDADGTIHPQERS